MLLIVEQLVYAIADKKIPVEIVRLIKQYIPDDCKSISVVTDGNEIVLRNRSNSISR